MKDFRNEIVHEYTNQNLIDLFKDILKYTNKLFDIVEKVKCYCSKYEQR
ncbi:MAG: capsule biosynthesis protein [Candidatus Scalindua sp.]|nr:capsule biosynthesis protein [Candidatus Scalindua sp.]MBT5306144.1 capsule biosynthesis protein [Candidatus Scalindua sp.]MBT6225732.1 capsule biosynthesis protein [Candidatus Scalindua sp.]MBT6564486.1 capsule biosynthesis protein [Candidatus Scalindua sp.]MBT7213072.1 capsule biosynthesis protein [Candidatus Scalindua sp.]